MSLTHVGELSLAVAVPGANAAALAGISGINLALPDILGRLEALAQFTPQPLTFEAQLGQAQAILTSIQACITLGLPLPSIDAQLAQIAALIAELLAAVEQIQIQLGIVTAFVSLLAAGGVHVYAYAGTVSGLGGALSGALGSGLPGGGGGGEACNALVLATTSGATWSAISTMFKVTP